MARLIGVNENGLRIGQYHQRAKLTDAQVEEMLDLRADGWGLRRLSKHFGVCRTHVKRIIEYSQRIQLSYVWRVVPLEEKEEA